MKTCSIEGCNRKHEARGWCDTHYKRWQRSGDPLEKKIAEDGDAINQDGYKLYAGKLEHIRVAEKAMGKKLPKGAVVHHVNENKLDNRPENLVVCSRALHIIIHSRMRALEACGNANWKRCRFCQKYDDPANLYINRAHANHRHCLREHRAAKRLQKADDAKQGVIVPGVKLVKSERLAIR